MTSNNTLLSITETKKYNMNKIILCIFLMVSLLPLVNAQHATLIDQGFDCESNSGYAEFELEGNQSEYEFFWSNGATTTRVEGLPPGIYVFTVIDLYGCLEEYEVGIYPNVDYLCWIDYTTVLNPINCTMTITLSFNHEDATVIWEDGYEGGLTRVVNLLPNPTEYCVSIQSNIDPCCSASICVPVPSNGKGCISLNGEG